MGQAQRSVPPAEEYLTNDMARVTWLCMQGFSFLRMEVENGICYWVFDDSPELQDLVGQFEDGQAMVEIKTYNQTFQRIRRQFYDKTDGRRKVFRQ